MQTQQLRYFLEVANTLNITTAARNLYISQPSLSQQIINLEKELGVPLLIRHSKSVTLTDAGEQFALHARRITGSMDQLSELMQKHSMMQKGTLRIGMLYVAGYLNLFQVLNDYHSHYPGLAYRLKIDGSAALIGQLLNRSIHAAFLIGQESRLRLREELYFQKVLDDYYVAVLSRRNPLSGKPALEIRDLKDQPIIMPAATSAFRRQVEQLFEAGGFQPEILCESSQPDIVCQLAAQNFGIGFSSYTIARTLQTKELAIVPLNQTLYRTIYYVTLKELLDYPSIHTFTKFVERYSFSKLSSL